MTTILGFKGIDLEKKEEYILIASDSQANSKKLNPDGTPLSINKVSRKIITHEKGNFAIAHSGRLLTVNVRDNEKIYELQKILTGQKNFKKKKLKNLLNSINYQLYEYEKRKNKFIFSLREKNKLSLYGIDAKNKIIQYHWILGGTGAKYSVGIINKIERKTLKCLPLEEAIKMAYLMIKTSSEKDVFTGGYFNYSILKKNSIENKFINFNLEKSLKEFEGYRKEDYSKFLTI